MTATDLLKEVLKDPMLKDKYNLSDEDILSASFDRTSNHQIIEVLKTIVLLKTQNQSDVNVYKQIKAITKIPDTRKRLMAMNAHVRTVFSKDKIKEIKRQIHI